MKQDLLIYSDNKTSYVNFYRNVGVLTDITYKLTDSISWIDIVESKILYLQNPWNDSYNEALKLAQNCNTPVWVDFTLFPFEDRSIHDPLYGLLNNEFNQEAMASILKNANYVTVCNSSHVEKFKYFNKNVSLIENSINSKIITPIDRFNIDTKVILWRSNTWCRDEFMSNFEEISNIIINNPIYQFIFIGDSSYLWPLEQFNNVNIVNNVNVIEYFSILKKLKPEIMFTFNSTQDSYISQEATHIGAISCNISNLNSTILLETSNKVKLYSQQKTANSCSRLSLQNIVRNNIVKALSGGHK